MQIMNKVTIIVALFLTLVSGVVTAQPIAVPGTEGFLVTVSSTNDVIATYQGTSASFSNDLFLGSTFIFNNHTSPVGSTVNLGSFAIGTELMFRLHVNNTGDDFFTGPASRNPDGVTHARVQENWQPNETLVSFEDLNQITFPGSLVYNDLSFSFTNTTSTPAIPEPETYAMMLAGLGLLAFVARRRKNQKAI